MAKARIKRKLAYKNNIDEQKTGAASKKTPERIKIIVDELMQGVPRKTAAALAGISIGSFQLWYTTDPEFNQLVEHAEQFFVSNSVKRINRAGNKSWLALGWLLERRHPEDFKERQEISVENLHNKIEEQIDILQQPGENDNAGIVENGGMAELAD